MSKIELLHQLIEGVGVLSQNIEEKGLTIPKIRSVLSPALRVWSEPNGIYLIQKIIGQKIFFKCRDHRLAIRECENRRLVEWTSPLRLHEIEMSGGLPVKLGPNKFVKIELDKQDAVVLLDSSAFFGQKLMCINGEFLTRSSIIDFVANRMGGSHSVSQAEKTTDLKFKKFRRLLGFTTDGKNIKMLMGTELDNLRNQESEGITGIDPLMLYVADAATRFVEGVQAILPTLNEKLSELKREAQSSKA